MKISLFLALAGLAPPLAAQEFQPHRAIYDLLPDGGSLGGNIDGRLVLEVTASCEDYQLNQRMVMRIQGGNGGGQVNDFRVALAERRDGLRLGFASQHYVNGDLDEERFGKARLNGPGQAGTASYRKPEGLLEDLPAGTTFPIAFNNRLLAAALAGEQLLRVVVFDGTAEGIHETVSFIGRRQDPADAGDVDHEILAGVAAWPVQTGYYRLGTQSEVPAFEVHMRLYANGVSGDVVLDYGDLRLRGRLVDLEAFDRPDCD